jgi:hypothetical protein
MLQEIIWWGRLLVISAGSVVFLSVGIGMLVGSYDLKNPLEFIAVFFASNFMILASAVGILYPAVQIFKRFRHKEQS